MTVYERVKRLCLFNMHGRYPHPCNMDDEIRGVLLRKYNADAGPTRGQACSGIKCDECPRLLLQYARTETRATIKGVSTNQLTKEKCGCKT